MLSEGKSRSPNPKPPPRTPKPDVTPTPQREFVERKGPMQYFMPGEADAIRRVVALARRWGYGNLINRLHMAWVLELYDKYGIEFRLAWTGSLFPLSRLPDEYEEDRFVAWCREYTAQCPDKKPAPRPTQRRGPSVSRRSGAHRGQEDTGG